MARRQDKRVIQWVAYGLSAVVTLTMIISLVGPVLIQEPATPTPTWTPEPTWTPLPTPTLTPTAVSFGSSLRWPDRHIVAVDSGDRVPGTGTG
jgi:hypothetical protein